MARSSTSASISKLPAATLLVASAVLLGALVRLSPALQADFPLNDGGMFYTMVQDVRTNGFSLPVYTSYNGGQIPFYYPPLAFYLAAGLAMLPGISSVGVFQFLPILISILTIPAFYRLARALTGSNTQGALATLAFALLARSFTWIIMGGGLTRSFGMLFAILALEQLYRLLDQQQQRFLLPSALFSSLTVLSHPEIAWFLLCSAAFFTVWKVRTWRMFAQVSLIGFMVLLFTAPWWLTVILRHGIEPLLSAFQVSGEQGFFLLRMILLYFTGESLTAVWGTLAILGLFAALATRKFLLPAWIAFIYVLSFRNEPYMLMLPVPILAAMGLDWVVLPAFMRLIDPAMAGPFILEDYLAKSSSRVLLAFLTGYGLLTSLLFPGYGLRTLPEAEREAMTWAAENTTADSQFLVLTGEQTWETDLSSEWFPALAKRTSLGTVQGTEWLPERIYDQTEQAYTDLQACALEETACLADWAAENQVNFMHVYLRKELLLNQVLMQSLEKEYRIIYENPAAAIFTRP
jgi:hypothetical protein